MAQLLETEEILRNHIAWRSPEDEVAGIVRLVLRQRKGNPEAGADAIYVAVPNKVWLKAFKQALTEARISTFGPKELSAFTDETQELPQEDFNGSVCLGSYGSIAAVKPVHLFATGLVEGFYPVGTEDEALLEAEAKVLKDAAATVSGTMIFSSFKRVTPEVAAALRLPALRVRREHDRQVAVVAPSHFIEDMDDESPETVSGEQFMANLFSQTGMVEVEFDKEPAGE